MRADEVEEAFELAVLGFDDEYIADCFAPISVDTLYEYCDAAELRKARMRGMKPLAQKAYEKALNGHAELLKMYMQHHLKFGEHKDIRLTGDLSKPIAIDATAYLTFDPLMVDQISKRLEDEF